MRRLVPILIVLVFTSSPRAEEIVIQSVSRTRLPGVSDVDNSWVAGVGLIKVTFKVPSETRGLRVRWGFYDAEKKLLRKGGDLPDVEIRSGRYQGIPKILHPERSYDFHFPIPPSLTGGANPWRTFVMELGHEESTAKAVFPTTSNAEDFSLDAEVVRSVVAAEDIKPSVRSISRYRNPHSAEVNDKWVNGLNTLKAKVQLESGAEAGDFFCRIYFFDAAKRKVFEWNGPPQVELNAREIVMLPAVWKNGVVYDIHFPIPSNLEKGTAQWRSAVVVFGNKQKIAALCYPASAKVEEFDFPEKEKLE